ncbi:MAG: cache domain-containing protein [Chloroflexi bacterium]|nr:cache domain-containing protein [Chloroflexota bacterium]
MLRTEQEGRTQANGTGRKSQLIPSGMNALYLLLIVVSSAAVLVACGDDPSPTPAPIVESTQEPAIFDIAPDTPTPEPTATPAPTPEPVATTSPEPTPEPAAQEDDDAITGAFVAKAIGYYGENGLDATVEFYRSPAGRENGRTLILLDQGESKLLVYRNIPALEGQNVGPGTRYSAFAALLEVANEEGTWTMSRGINPATRQEEPRRVFTVLHDGLVFSASHSVLVEDVGDSVKGYVDKAIAKYEDEGLDAVISHYNGQDSLDGQFYLFLIGEDDNYLAHPIFPHLIGTDIKDVVGSDGQELGKEIAQATGEGVWVEYLWPHPISRKEQQKVTWAIRHDGLIFASGYYAGEPETGPPAWRDADPRDYTVKYVNEAVERYEREGLESMLNYYNSVASFEGEWYLFATDDKDIYHVHPLLPQLIGTDIKGVIGSDGYTLGEELAKATEEGVWVEYLWPHPVTLKEVPKVSYAVRRDGMLFASGYYERVEDPAGQTAAYVQEAIEYYGSNGLEATIARYNSDESLDGQWGLTLADENDILRVAPLGKHLIGTNLKDLATFRRRDIGQEMAAATEEGSWINYIFPNVRSSETLYAHTWAVRHDGLLFMSRYYDDKPDVPDAP